MKEKHAWFSPTAAESCGTATYLNAEGEEVVITFLTDSDEKGDQWPDTEYRGTVVRFVSSNMKVNHNFK